VRIFTPNRSFPFSRRILVSDHRFSRIAGSDTTASTLRAALLHLATSPIPLRRLLHEIDCGVKAGTISSPVTEAEARDLSYLQAVIRETLRLWPPISSLMAREDLSPGKQDSNVLGNIRIPKGTAVCWSAWAVLHSKDVFGEDADIFSPDRWLPREDVDPAKEKDRIRTMDQIVDLCFGAGKWQCLGRPIAMIELGKAIVEV
jgi:cytochrome P450